MTSLIHLESAYKRSRARYSTAGLTAITAVDATLPLVAPGSGFVHLHRHGEYSLLDGLGTAAQYADEAVVLGHTALAITDHGSLSGVLHHIKECEARGIKPIVGIEAYFKIDRTIHDASNKRYYHLVLLAQNIEGWKNMMRMSSESFASGFYYKPCVDIDLLMRFNEGIVASTSCAAGSVPQAIIAGDDPELALNTLLKIFGDRLFVEIQPNDWDPQRLINVEISNLAIKHGLMLAATADVHYPYKDWYETQDLMLMMSTGQTLASRAKADALNEDYMKGYPSNWLMSEHEMKELFTLNHPALPSAIVDEAISNTRIVADWIEGFTIDKSPKIPKAADTPEEAERIVATWCEEGLVRIGKEQDPTYRERLEYELGILRDKEVCDYFYIIGDLVRWSKAAGIRVGAGRGSAAGSLVAYLTRITAVDPIGHGLLFERFLNPDRRELPDIDIDFQHNRREEAKEYLSKRWGPERVANVAAFQTFGMASSLQSVARVLNLDTGEVMSATKTLKHAIDSADAPEGTGEMKLADLVEFSKPLEEYSVNHPEAWKHAQRLEGGVKAQGRHPAGVVITDVPVTEYMPTMRSSGGQRVTAWSERASFPIITEYGFLKIDALSTDGLTIQQYAADLVRQNRGDVIDFEDPKQFPVIEDPRAVEPEVMQKFAEGKTLGVFQFESWGITGLLKQIKPDWLGEICAANALYRPGALDADTTFEYAKRKHGEKPWSHVHPVLAPILDETFGIIAYQEQVMQVASSLGGFTPAEADEVRKIMTKWHSNKLNTRRGETRMSELEGQFMSTATQQHGLSKLDATEVWDWLKAFARYGFNKSHSRSYGLQAYQDMWLKVHYPVEFYASLLTFEPKKVPRIIGEALGMGVKLSPPDINKSSTGFTVDGDRILFGLNAIRDVGGTACQEIEDKRPFKDYDDFVDKVLPRKCNSKVKSALVNAGAFDWDGGRAGMSEAEKTVWEKQLIGYPLSSKMEADKHVDLVKSLIDKQEDIIQKLPKDNVQVGGQVTSVKVWLSRTKQQEMARVNLEFEDDEYVVTFFHSDWMKYRNFVYEGETILVQGTLDGNGVAVNATYACTLEKLVTDMARV